VNAINDKTYRERVYEIVRQIPIGRVMTYGQIAFTLGAGYTARTVGYCMHAADEGVPWQRVINSQGKISTDRLTLPHSLQQGILESEGVTFDQKGKCDLRVYQWHPEGIEPEADEQTTLFR
jgi:methylated-DNA-protein-cysteine methyltransferase related protein